MKKHLTTKKPKTTTVKPSKKKKKGKKGKKGKTVKGAADTGATTIKPKRTTPPDPQFR